MRVEIVEEAEDQAPAPVFPPEKDFLDLRANPQGIEEIAAARQYLPLRNFLGSVNGEESIFTTAAPPRNRICRPLFPPALRMNLRRRSPSCLRNLLLIGSGDITWISVPA